MKEATVEPRMRYKRKSVFARNVGILNLGQDSETMERDTTGDIVLGCSRSSQPDS